MRKLRTWICPCCKSSWHRRKSQASGPFCGTCAQRTVPGRSYPTPVKCTHRRALRKVATFKEIHYTAPRCASGHVLGLTSELRSTWGACRRAKTRPALVRRAALWVAALETESQRRDGYSKWIDGYGTVRESRTRIGVPKLITADSHYGTLGTYHWSLMDGKHSITVALDQPLDEVRETLIHEALHFLDQIAGLGASGHDCYWHQRLARMRAMFPVTAWGTRRP